MSNKAALLLEKGAQLVVEDRRIPKPRANELLIKNHAIATNPVDWKMQDYGVFIDRYPTTLGSDVAGVVEAVGENVKGFIKGDRVAGFACVLQTKNQDEGAFQQYTVVHECAATKLPKLISFEEGSILPMAVATAAVGIFVDLAVARPPQKQHGAFLVWGASSSVGTAAIQIARECGFTIYGVCSARHYAYVESLGAKKCFDYNDPSIVQNIVQFIKAANEPSIVAYDVISENGSAPQMAEVVSALGGGKLCLTLPYPEDAKKPHDVETTVTYAERLVDDQKEFSAWLFGDWLAKSLAKETYVPSPAIERVNGGIAAVQKAIDMHKQGLSGKKLVLSL